MLISGDEHDALVPRLAAGLLCTGRRDGAALIAAADDLFR